MKPEDLTTATVEYLRENVRAAFGDAPWEDRTDAADALAELVRRAEESTTWAGLMAHLDRHYPADATVEGGLLDGPGGMICRLTREVDALRTERDRLARILAVERGDESQAPAGWWVSRAGLWAHGPKRGPVDAEIQHAGIGRWALSVWVHGAVRFNGVPSVTALEAMEAADLARGTHHD